MLSRRLPSQWLFRLQILIAFLVLNSSSALKNKFQIITLCNTQPSILKCQNKLHFLIINRVMTGLSETNDQEECKPQLKCIQEIFEPTESTFDCTGSKACIVYPSNSSISINSCNGYKSNLIQLHITCASLAHLNEYLSRNNKRMFKTYLALKNTSELHLNNHNQKLPELKNETLPSFEFLINNTDNSLLPQDAVRFQRHSSTMTNSIIIIGLTCFYTFLILIIITLFYFRNRRFIILITILRIKHLVRMSGIGVSQTLDQVASIVSSSASSTTDITFTTPIPKFPTDTRTNDARMHLIDLKRCLLSVFTSQNDEKSSKNMGEHFTDISLSLKSRDISCTSYTYENLHFTDESGANLESNGFSATNDCANVYLQTADIVSLSSDEDEMEISEDSICILQDLYAYYYNPYKQGASSTGYASNFVLYDIPEEGDLDDDSSENFVEILKI